MTDKAMDTLGFGEDDKAAVFRVLAALLHLGNVRFEVRGCLCALWCMCVSNNMCVMLTLGRLGGGGGGAWAQTCPTGRTSSLLRNYSILLESRVCFANIFRIPFVFVQISFESCLCCANMFGIPFVLHKHLWNPVRVLRTSSESCLCFTSILWNLVCATSLQNVFVLRFSNHLWIIVCAFTAFVVVCRRRLVYQIQTRHYVYSQKLCARHVRTRFQLASSRGEKDLRNVTVGVPLSAAHTGPPAAGGGAAILTPNYLKRKSGPKVHLHNPGTGW